MLAAAVPAMPEPSSLSLRRAVCAQISAFICALVSARISVFIQAAVPLLLIPVTTTLNVQPRHSDFMVPVMTQYAKHILKAFIILTRKIDMHHDLPK